MSRYDVYKKPIDYDTADQVGGEELVEFLQCVGVRQILDVDEFAVGENRYPAIGSIFLLGEGGSYDFKCGRFRVKIYNGTIDSVNGVHLDEFGEQYYELSFGKKMLTRNEFGANVEKTQA